MYLYLITNPCCSHAQQTKKLMLHAKSSKCICITTNMHMRKTYMVKDADTTETENIPLDTGAHYDVIKWKHLPRYWPFVRGIHRSPANSPHKGQWGGALMFSLICVWINGWVNNREAGDLRRYRAHYDVTVMIGCHMDVPNARRHPHHRSFVRVTKGR